MSLNGLRLLVVDDDPDTRELLTIFFQYDGADIVTVASASEALEAISRVEPDILISDICLPDEDGYSLLLKVRNIKTEQGGEIPAIALTGCVRKDERVRALSAGFRKHLSKPVDLDELTSVVTRLAEFKQLL